MKFDIQQVYDAFEYFGGAAQPFMQAEGLTTLVALSTHANLYRTHSHCCPVPQLLLELRRKASEPQFAAAQRQSIVGQQPDWTWSITYGELSPSLDASYSFILVKDYCYIMTLFALVTYICEHCPYIRL